MTQEVLAIFREEGIDLVQRALSALNRAANSAGPERSKQITDVCRLLHTIKGAAAAVGHEDIKDRAHALEDQIAALGPAPEPKAFDGLFVALEQIESLLDGVPSPEPAAAPEPMVSRAPVEPPTPQPPAPRPSAPAPRTGGEPAGKPDVDVRASFSEWLRVPPERVDQLQANLAELVLTRLQQDELVDNMVGLRACSSQAMKRQRDLGRMLLELRSELSPETWRRLRVSVQLLTRAWGEFQDGLQEVCRDARVLQAQSAVVSQTVEESIQDLRLMPLGPFLEGFAKTAREAARRDGKEVRFDVGADEAEVDRAVLVRLHDAVLHLVRNAVVHGLETAQQRQARGKPRVGQVMLQARSIGNHVLIEVCDDGAGVDAARVREKARQQGIPETEDLLDMLTHPGFSTRGQVDELAGRGVGLDVVASIVRGLEGTLELSSVRGQGSSFTLRVPVTATTARGLLLEVGERRFAIMLSGVERVLRPSHHELGEVEGRPAIRLDDEMVGLVALSDLLEMQEEDGDDAGPMAVVILRQARRRLALSVREIPEEHALVVRPFGRAFRNMDLFVGGSVQPDHSVVPVLSTGALFKRVARPRRAAAPARVARPARRHAEELAALVVDDSITMRTMLRNILSAAGYAVTVAEDGEAALSALEGMARCHIVITDLQMPRMDGTQLCRRIRERGGSYLPIVMVTSVDEDEEKARALEAGADAYVVKASFEQVSFLDRINTLARGPQ